MEHMSRKLLLAAFLGILVGVAIGYSPLAQPMSAPRAQLLMGQAGQTNVVSPSFQPVSASGASASGPEALFIAILAGLAVALPVFLIARRSQRV